MSLLREMLTDGWSGRGSSKRAALLIATLALSAALILLALAAYVGRIVDVAIGSVAAALAGLGGAAYVGGKSAEHRAADGAAFQETLQEARQETPAQAPGLMQPSEHCQVQSTKQQSTMSQPTQEDLS